LQRTEDAQRRGIWAIIPPILPTWIGKLVGEFSLAFSIAFAQGAKPLKFAESERLSASKLVNVEVETPHAAGQEIIRADRPRTLQSREHRRHRTLLLKIITRRGTILH
jgi:hypothetical protein